MRLTNKVALVTGGTRGIGWAIAQRLAAEGAQVVICGRDSQRAQEVAAQYSPAGQIIGYGLDVADAEACASFIDQLVKDLGRLHILVNNAGITRDGLLLRMKEEDWDTVLGVNLKSMYNLCRPAVRAMMKERWGRIINISSVVGLMGNPGQTNYAAAKAGIIGFTKSLAKEVASRGITANVIAPGFIDTDMTRVLSEEQLTRLQREIPLGRVGRSEDIANGVAFLASEEAAYITGQVLQIDGGLAM
ncbi:MAG: 3-oxoacyl-ACP reductase FabG [Limnochordia bacterium]|jgi:3-oxoacyl-[acyl-carrier protein] reductase